MTTFKSRPLTFVVSLAAVIVASASAFAQLPSKPKYADKTYPPLTDEQRRAADEFLVSYCNDVKWTTPTCRKFRALDDFDVE